MEELSAALPELRPPREVAWKPLLELVFPGCDVREVDGQTSAKPTQDSMGHVTTKLFEVRVDPAYADTISFIREMQDG